MKTKTTTKRHGDDLVESVVVRFGGSPVLRGVKHLGNEDRLDQSRGDQRTWRRVSGVDSGDEVGCVSGLGADGVELQIPLAVALEDEAEIFVVVNEFDVVGVESDRVDGSERRAGFALKKKKLCLGSREFKVPLLAPRLETKNEISEEPVLSEVALTALVLRPTRSIISEQRKTKLKLLLVVKVIDIDGEEERRENAPLRNTSRGREPFGALVVLGDSELTVGEKSPKPTPSLAVDGSMGVKLVEQEVVRDAVESLDDV